MNEETLFAEVLGKQGAERAAFLDEHCKDDIELRKRLEGLLQAHDHPDPFLEAAAPVATVDSPIRETAGTTIGPYKLLEQIGEGGMGSVWMAQQTEPVKRLVAMKLIKAGMDSKQVIARFEAERQALALMDHPNIAKVHDAGTTEADRPYFVMELVKGVPITRYCDEHHLTPRQRLELFIPVCHAIQHAHQKGIIHRDLKPSNVLVAQYDGRPVPKVIDFGVAKAAGQSLTDRTLVTGFGAIVGTLEYMSPEQAEINQLDIDTRSDIYSLGVLLYELLTGSTPFSKKDLEKAGMLEMLRIIREDEPSKPSTKLSSSDALPSLSASRGTEPAKLTKIVRGELDWIVMKALEKDRGRRYETANGFAADVQRYLADEPVQACPPSVGYRFRKFARRNQSGLAVSGLILFLLVLLGSVAGWAWRDRTARAREAELERVARTAEQTNNLERAVERAELLQREGKRGEALAALERAQLLAREAEPAPPVAERIESLQQLLDAEGRDEVLIAHFEALQRQVLTEVQVERNHFRGVDARPRIREALEQYGIAMGVTRPDAAVAHIQKRPAAVQTVIVALIDECAGYWSDPAVSKWLIDLMRKLDSDPWRIEVRRAIGKRHPGTLEALLKDIDARQHPPHFLLLVATRLPHASPGRLELARRVQIAYPGDFWANHELGLCLLSHAGKDAEAIRYFTAALALRPDNPGVLLNRAICLDRVGELEAAVADLERAITLSPRYAAAHYALGRSLYAQKKPNEATAALRKAIELDPNLADAYRVLGAILRDQQKLPEAIAAYRRAIELDPENAYAHYNLGNALGTQNKLDEAIAAYRRAIELDPKWALAHDGLGYALHGQKKLEQAITSHEKAIELDPKHAPYHRNLGRVLRDLALRDQKKLDAAVAAYRKAIELDPKYAAAYYDLGQALRDQKKFDAAVAAYGKAIELDPDKAVWLHTSIGALFCDDLGEYDKAIDCFRTALKLDPNFVPARTCLGIALSLKGWALVDGPEPELRDPKLAIEVMKGAVELFPTDSACWQYMGWVQYRVGDWQASIEALEKSCKLQAGGTGDAGQWIVLALAHARLAAQAGLPEKEREHHQSEARRRFDQADKQIECLWRARPGHVAGRAIWDFRAEARELMAAKDGKK